VHIRRVLPVLFLASAIAWSQPYVISTIAGGVGPVTPAVGLSASVSPTAIAVDQSGNLYFSSRQSIFLLDVKGTLTRVAGNSRAGFSGDGGPAANAQLNNPKGLALDSAGNLYIADSNNGRVRRVSTAGTITTIAGAANDLGYDANWGDGGPAAEALLFMPVGVAFDSAGNLYIADGRSVRKVSADGTIRTVAGNSTNIYSYGDGGPAIQATMNPTAIAVDSNHLYIAENNRVRMVSPDGIISTVAGNPWLIRPYWGEGGPATNAILGSIGGIATDGKGNLYIADTANYRLFKVGTDGIISTVAGNGNSNDSGDGGPAASAGLSGPMGVALDPSGNLYLPELSNRLRRITPGGTIATVAGNGVAAYSGDGGPASAAQLYSPWGVAVDAQGNLFISDSGNHTIRKVEPNGTIATVAGTGIAGFSGDGGAAAGAQLNTPLGIALDGTGSLYVADCQNQRVRRISAGGSIATVAGNGVEGFAGDGGPATQAQLSCPHGVAVDSAGNLFIGDTENSRVRKVGPDGVISTIAGTGAQGLLGDGGPAVQAQLYSPTSLALDASGNLFIADTGHSLIRKVTRDGVISTVAGEPPPRTYADPGDGRPSTQTSLNGPQGLAVDSGGNLYIGETNGNHIRRVSASGIVSTIAGSGLYGQLASYDSLTDPEEFGYTGDGGPATSAKLYAPFGVAVDSSSNIYFADLPNSAVRILQPSPIANAASILAGPIAPGELVTLYGSGLGPSQLTTSTPGLTATQVLFNGVPAPVVYSSATQVAAVAPDSLSGTSVKVEVRYQGKSASTFTASVAPSAPALFTADATGKGLAAAINQDGSYNTSTNSAAIGKTVSLFVTGAGVPPLQPVSVTIGGEPAEVQHVGSADGAMGILRIDVLVPSNVLANLHFLIGQDINVPLPLAVQIGNAVSQPGIYVTVNYCSAGCVIGDVLHRPLLRRTSPRPPVLSARNVKLK
jgi:uncharacterized protein (TIGR03437 family)